MVLYRLTWPVCSPLDPAATNLQGSSCDKEAELRGEEPDSLGQGRVLVLDAMSLVDQQVAPPDKTKRREKYSTMETEDKAKKSRTTTTHDVSYLDTY